MALVLMVVAPERFRDEELFDTRSELAQAGHQTVIASTRTGLYPGSRGGHVMAALTLEQVQCREYAAVVFVGGGGSKLLFHNGDAWRIAQEMAQAGKVVAAICLAPVILANAGVLQGHRATVAGTEATTITAQGAQYTGPGITVDGNVVTANGPKSSWLFGRSIAQLLAARAAAQVTVPWPSGRGRLVGMVRRHGRRGRHQPGGGDGPAAAPSLSRVPALTKDMVISIDIPMFNTPWNGVPWLFQQFDGSQG